MRIPTLLLLAAALVLPTLCFADGPYQLKFTDSVKTIRIYTGQCTATVAMSEYGGTPHRYLEQITHGERVESLTDGKANLTVKTKTVSSLDDEDETNDGGFPIAPTKVTSTFTDERSILRSPLGICTFADKPAGAEVQSDLASIDTYGVQLQLPDHAVAIGDEWHAQGKAAHQVLVGLMLYPAEADYTANFTVQSEKQVANKTMVVITGEYAITCKQTIDVSKVIAGLMGKPNTPPAKPITMDVDATRTLHATIVFDPTAGEIYSTDFTDELQQRTTTHKDNTETTSTLNSSRKGTLTRDYDTAKYIKKQ